VDSRPNKKNPLARKEGKSQTLQNCPDNWILRSYALTKNFYELLIRTFEELLAQHSVGVYGIHFEDSLFIKAIFI